MGKTKFIRAKEFLEEIKALRGSVLDFIDFKKEMMIKIGADEKRTMIPYMKLMLDTKLISQEDTNVRIN